MIWTSGPLCSPPVILEVGDADFQGSPGRGYTISSFPHQIFIGHLWGARDTAETILEKLPAFREWNFYQQWASNRSEHGLACERGVAHCRRDSQGARGGCYDRTEGKPPLARPARAAQLFKHLLHGHPDGGLMNAVLMTSRPSSWGRGCQQCGGLKGSRHMGQMVAITKMGSLTPPIIWNSIAGTQWPGHF